MTLTVELALLNFFHIVKFNGTQYYWNMKEPGRFIVFHKDGITVARIRGNEPFTELERCGILLTVPIELIEELYL